MKKILLLILIIASIVSCKKENVIATGKITYSNISPNGNRYEFFLNGTSLGLLNANRTFDKIVPVGSYVVKAVQYEGFLITPTTKQTTLTVGKNGVVIFQFP